MGDSAIKEIASIILKVISKEDIAIRYGGDEFIIITNYSSKDLSTKITDEVFSFNKTKKYPFSLSTSIGYYLAHQNDDFETAINQADALMYQIKKDKKAQRN